MLKKQPLILSVNEKVKLDLEVLGGKAYNLFI